MEATARNAVLFFNHRPQRFRIEQTQGALEHWTEFVAGLQHVDGMDFHQRFQPLRQRRFSTAHRPQQIENLLALFQTLSCVPEEADDALDGFFHAIEYGEGGRPWPYQSFEAHRSQLAGARPHWHIASDRLDTIPDIPPSTCRFRFEPQRTERKH